MKTRCLHLILSSYILIINRARFIISKEVFLIINDKLKLADQLCFSSYNVSRLFTRFYENALTQFNLTFPQYLVLTVLWESEEDQTLQSIGQQLDLSSNTLSPLLKRLEDAGWITRRRLDSDRRQLGVYMTNKAKLERRSITEEISKCVAAEIDIEKYTAAKQAMEMLEISLKTMLDETSPTIKNEVSY